MIFPTADAEAERLGMLRSMGILDTPPEASFDRLVTLAARLFNVPIALVSLVDGDRQWFKARCGLDFEQTPRSSSFCAHAILGDEVMVVPDAALDARFAGNPLVTGEPRIRFYAGAPLITPGGQKLGTLCIIDRQPRGMTGAECASLRDLAAMTVDEMLLRRASADLSDANARLRRTLEENRKLASAVESVGAGVIVVDPRLPDEPITFANRAFADMTGYEPAEVLGRNCRFLQGAETDRAEAARLRDAVRSEQPFRGTLLNYRKDGAPFWNALTINPVFDEAGKLVNFIGVQVDVSVQRRAETAVRERVRQAAAVAELGQRALAGADLDALFQAAADLAAHTLGVELCRVTERLPDSTGLLVRAGVGWPPGSAAATRIPAGPQTLAGRALESGKPFVLQDIREEPRFAELDPAYMHGAVSGVSVVIRGRGEPFGVLGVMSRHTRRFTPEDVYFLQGIANVLAAAIDRRRDEEALRRSETRFQRIAANVPGMVYQSRTSPDGIARARMFVSDGCREIFGVEPAALYDQPGFIGNCVHPEDHDGFQRTVAESAATLEPWRWQGRIIVPRAPAAGGEAAGREVKWIQCIARPEPQEDGDLLWDGLLMDITKSKRNEELTRAKETAERANAAKSEFLSRMSHELRTPLNAILGFGQLLEMTSTAAGAADGGKRARDDASSVEYILAAGRHLLKLVDEVLDLARIESGRVELSPEPLPVNLLLKEALSLIGPLALRQGISLDAPALPPGPGTPDGPHVLADRQRFKQVLINLLSNAVKYNVPGGSIVVDCAAGPEAGRLRIRVADTGRGIAEDLRERLFTPFDRLGAESGAVQGTGLGLALSRRLIEAMGGRIGMESQVAGEPARGSVFWVELPLAASPVEAAEENGAFSTRNGWLRPEDLPAGRTLLYIEDNLSNLRLVERLMERFPHVRLLTAMQGSIGLELARQHLPDLILLDVHLPDLPGCEVLRELRAHAGTRGIKVVAVSADATQRQIERMLMLGAAGYLTKPIDVRQFLEVIRQAFDDKAPGGTTRGM